MKTGDFRPGLRELKVKYSGKNVGTLALSGNGKTAFSYDEEWLETGFSVSPFSLPFEKKVFVPKNNYFGGLFGVFADSLPDAWGRLLVNRIIKKYGTGDDVTVLDRLAIAGKSGMGALEYEPDYNIASGEEIKNLDFLSEECCKILRTEFSEELDSIYRLGGSSTWFGEHTTSVDGNGKNPGEKELLNVGLKAGMSRMVCLNIISEIKEKVSVL